MTSPAAKVRLEKEKTSEESDEEVEVDGLKKFEMQMSEKWMLRLLEKDEKKMNKTRSC